MDLWILVDRSRWKLVSATLETDSITAIISLRLKQAMVECHLLCYTLRGFTKYVPVRLRFTMAGFTPYDMLVSPNILNRVWAIY
ncbi:unnamed protein product [Musa acuminata subsp. malaccensis]|uniref:(wild Malaysian banana) hypothetical protein n=1 Tax=Musa acuminata subsp. malaccensis TaxID=214687 RepID=A0A804KPX9_MUSAM|nr:unnamed protein product [Musa acuminata subsp. malaccensis]